VDYVRKHAFRTRLGARIAAGLPNPLADAWRFRAPLLRRAATRLELAPGSVNFKPSLQFNVPARASRNAATTVRIAA
jgi:hypothetical protein